MTDNETQNSRRHTNDALGQSEREAQIRAQFATAEQIFANSRKQPATELGQVMAEAMAVLRPAEDEILRRGLG